MHRVSIGSVQKAAQVWCHPDAGHIEMDATLCRLFAETIDDIWSKPWLGNATTRELLQELSTRIDLDYKTVNEL